VTVNPDSNTATVSEGATGAFTLIAVPEPSAALLAVISGGLGLVWLWCTRKGRGTAVPAPDRGHVTTS
jgi:hypothetical protein